MKQHQLKYIAAAALTGLLLLALTISIVGNGRTDQTKLDMVLCLDDSSSMYGKAEERDYAAQELCKVLGRNTTFGGLYYQFQTTEVQKPLRLYKFTSKRRLIQFFNKENKEKDGNTNIGVALDKAIEMLRNESDESREKAILLFADGNNDYKDSKGIKRTKYIKKANTMTTQALEKAKKYGIPVHVVYLNKKSSPLMKKIGKSTNGSYLHIKNINQLEDSFQTTANNIYETHDLEKQSNNNEVLILLLLATVIFVSISIPIYRWKKRNFILDSSLDIIDEENRLKGEENRLKEEMELEQKNKSFYLDFIITHGNAIGGRSCLDNDGYYKKGAISLREVEMIGQNQKGEDYIYYIDEEDLSICASVDKDAIHLNSNGSNFEIRRYGTARDLGKSTKSARLQKDILYYIVLESKHEITIKAMDFK